MPKHGKKYEEASKLVDKAALYEVSEAIELVKKTATAKFDETVEVAFKLGVDPRQSDQMIRGAVVLPNGTGKTKKVLVLAKGDAAKAAAVAELKAIRAYSYFNLARAFQFSYVHAGENAPCVPLYTEPTSSETKIRC